MTDRNTLRVGVVGAGKMARWHLRAYARIPGVRIAAIANPQSARGRALQRRHRIPAHFDSGLELIRQAEVDAVDLCLPTAAHVAHLTAALDRGLHVYCEKPLATTDAEYADAIAAARQRGVVLFNGYNYPYLPEFARIRAALQAGVLGEVRYIRFFRATKEHPDSSIMAADSVGLLHECHGHFIDLLEHFGFGAPRRVRAVGTAVWPWPLRPDTATIQMEYANGRLAEITMTLATPGLAPTLLAIGTQGTLTLTAGRVRIVPARAVWSLPAAIALLFRESVTLPWRVLRNPFLGACRHWVACIRDGRPNPSDAASARRTHRLLDAAQRSLETALPVELEGNGSDGAEGLSQRHAP